MALLLPKPETFELGSQLEPSKVIAKLTEQAELHEDIKVSAPKGEYVTLSYVRALPMCVFSPRLKARVRRTDTGTVVTGIVGISPFVEALFRLAFLGVVLCSLLITGQKGTVAPNAWLALLVVASLAFGLYAMNRAKKLAASDSPLLKEIAEHCVD